jgi:glutathione S-transferase
MVLKLYSNPYSTCSQRVFTVMKEKGLEYEVVLVDLMKGEQKDPVYMQKHPFGQVPYLDDDGFIVYESRAICRYLALKYADRGEPLIPSQTDLKALALFEQAASVEYSRYTTAAGGLVGEAIIKTFHGGTPDPEVVAKYKLQLSKCLDVYETILSKQPYAAGNKFTVVDIYHIPYAALFEKAGAGELIPERPNVKAWWDRISGRESWKSVMASA